MKLCMSSAQCCFWNVRVPTCHLSHCCFIITQRPAFLPTEPFIFVNLIELGMIHPGHHSGGRLYYVIPSVTIRKLSPREQLQCLCFVCGNECPVFRVLGPTCFSCVSIRIPECPNRAVQPLQSSYRMFIEAGHGFLSRGTQFVAVIPL